jgi:hypothetical protein
LVEMLGLTDDGGAGVCRAEQVFGDDAKVRSVEVEESRQLVVAPT